MFRTLVASGVLALLVGAAFTILLLSIDRMRSSAALARHSESVLAAANQLERLVVDLETGERGYLITGQPRYLQPWRAATKSIPSVSAELQQLTQVPEQHRRALAINAAIDSYIRDYSLPLVRAEQRDPRNHVAREVEAVGEGKRRVDAIRHDFDSLVDTERALAASRQDRAVAAAHRVALAAGVGIAASVVLVLAFAAYLVRVVLRPVSRAAGMADRLAGGDLSVRMPEAGPAEVRELEHSFNTMARSLEQSRDDLRVLAEEQAGLRRVATLVAHRASPAEVFDAVTREVGQLLDAASTRLARYEPDGTMTVLASRSAPGVEIPPGTNTRVEGMNIAALVAASGRSAQMDNYEKATGEPAEPLREMGVKCAVGAPISVEGRLWGVMIAGFTDTRALGDIETRMAQFTELAATAIANAESRAELAASRARVVATSDETRRRIERDLHDGTQQRLIALGLELRAAGEIVPPELDDLQQRLARASAGLAAVVQELQELTRGIHPAILSHGGLKPALRNLARRAGLPVELDIRSERRLPEQVEVAAYYTISEALTNATKHAQASLVRVEVEEDGDTLRLSVRDDGIGGADPTRGSGLVGLRDRVEALDGCLKIESRPGEGTSLVVEIPTAPRPKGFEGAAEPSGQWVVRSQLSGSA